MTVKTGWIKLYCQTLDSEFWDTGDPFDYQHAFMHVLLSANWKTGRMLVNGKVFTIKRGQWMTSTVKLAARFHWSRNKVTRWLKIMHEFGMLDSEQTGFGTLITVVNYSKYQGDGGEERTGVETGVETGDETAIETRVETGVGAQSKTYRYTEVQNKDTILAPSVPTAVCEDAWTGEEDAEDDDEGYMTHDELRQFLESYYAEHPIGNGAAGCAVQEERE